MTENAAHCISEVLISQADIATRVRALGEEISASYSGCPLTVIMLSNGALIFGADLVRSIDIPLQLDTMTVSSYAGTRSTNKITVLSKLKLEVRDRHVLVVDDIYDTGLTMSTIVGELNGLHPISIRTCVLLNKQRPRTVDLVPDYSGFDIDDQFVVGYGLDYNEHYRNLPYIGILDDGAIGEDVDG
jgi:hypoxanthine phosphoribosyltransferase